MRNMKKLRGKHLAVNAKGWTCAPNAFYVTLLTADGQIGTGWTYSPCTVPAMLGAIDLALTTYRQHHRSWEALMLSGMSKDLSWGRAARQYEQIFQWTLQDPPARYD